MSAHLRDVRPSRIMSDQQTLIDLYGDIALGLRLIQEQLLKVDPAIAIPGKYHERRARMRMRHHKHIADVAALLESCDMLHRLATYTTEGIS